MIAYVTGATGYTGQRLAVELASRGVQVIAHLRPGAQAPQALRVEGITLEERPWTLEAMTQALSEHRPDLIFFLVGTTKRRMSALGQRGEDPQAASYLAIDYGLAAMLLAATRAASLTQARFIYLSSMGVSAQAPGQYLQARWRFESELRASGQPHVIARPGLITGSDRQESRPLERLSGAISRAVLAPLGATSVARRWRPTDAAELARALARHALHPTSPAMTLEAEALKDDSP